jgi:hypothetical protein
MKKLHHKDAVRAYILERLEQITTLDLANLTAELGLSWEQAYETAKIFDDELWRIKKLFNYPVFPSEYHQNDTP